MFGMFNIDKPRGMTSRQAVDHVQRLVRPAKAGHAGTLDPLASGVLVVCVGPATRLTEYIQQLPKKYRAAFLLGRSSDTDDTEGHVIELDAPPRPTLGQILSTVTRFVGEILQRPPEYSALKVQGRRAYELARRGETFSLVPRPVRVDRIDVVSYEYPELRIEVVCGSGTYVRALGRDLAASLGTAAVMSELTRTAIGDFALDEACSLDQLQPGTLSPWLLPPVRAFPGTRPETLSDDESQQVLHGRALERRSHGRAGVVPALDARGRMVAVLVPWGRDRLRPVRTFR